jgi:hypothetical protein
MPRTQSTRDKVATGNGTGMSGEGWTTEVAGVSGFGGHLLTGDGAYGAAADGGSDLAALGITDAEQLVALAAVPGVKEELAGVFGDGLQALLDQATQLLSAERAAEISTPLAADRGLGVLPPTDEMLAAAMAPEVEEAPEAVALPSAVDLRAYMSPIRNQGSRGTCVAFTITALNEYIQRRRGLVRDLSEQHLYYETKLIDGAPNACGTWQAKAVIALQTRGECLESIWPYNPNPPCNNHGALPALARPNGLSYRLSTLAVPARNVAFYKAHMARQRAVGVSIPVYDSWYRSAETARSGRITMRVGNEAPVGGHAVLLVGYQDSAASPGGGYFIVRNHWSTAWAYQSPYGPGYGTIPYQYIANDAMEAFTAVVPGVGAEDDGTHQDDATTDGKETVTIEVGRNVKITIASS